LSDSFLQLSEINEIISALCTVALQRVRTALFFYAIRSLFIMYVLYNWYNNNSNNNNISIIVGGTSYIDSRSNTKELRRLGRAL